MIHWIQTVYTEFRNKGKDGVDKDESDSLGV